MTRILIAEDEERISSFIDKGLRAAGYSTEVVANGREALALALGGTCDLVLLDVGLPGMDGFEILRHVRDQDTALPIIMLTARTSTPDTVTGLDGGANDYMPKPFKFDELLARVRLRLRDVGQLAATTLRRGSISLDLLTRRATVDGREVDLSAREFALAEEFLTHPDQVLSREQLLSRVWGLDFDPGS
ncbi:unnamed protein product, partial [Oppiella nova]